MPTTAPPFPTTHSPQLDILLRELYARVTTAETVLGIGEGIPGTPSVPPVTDIELKIVEAIPVKLLQAFVPFDAGWGLPGWPQLSNPVLLGAPIPPFVVLDVTVNSDVAFNYELGNTLVFGVGTSRDDGLPEYVDPRRYYARSSRDISTLSWPGEEMSLDYVGGSSLNQYQNIGVVQTQSRPIVAGGFWQARPFDDWPANMRGQVQVLVLYADSNTAGESVPLSELADKTLLTPIRL